MIFFNKIGSSYIHLMVFCFQDIADNTNLFYKAKNCVILLPSKKDEILDISLKPDIEPNILNAIKGYISLYNSKSKSSMQDSYKQRISSLLNTIIHKAGNNIISYNIVDYNSFKNSYSEFSF